MNKQLKNAFAKIEAEQSLKDSTKAFVFTKTNGYESKKRSGFKYTAVAFTCVALIFVVACIFYFVPVASIRIDSGNRTELYVNVFDRVAFAKSSGELKKTELINLKYVDAVDYVIASEQETPQSKENDVKVSVVSDNEERCSQMMKNVEHCNKNKGGLHHTTAKQQNVETDNFENAENSTETQTEYNVQNGNESCETKGHSFHHQKQKGKHH
ncbi:MAG: hypothetical protein IJ433_07185 [Ruminococcus sp.]|nr:hypothetical protein [Ruminococcus sp.]